MSKLQEIKEALEANMLDGDTSSVESNACDLLQLAETQDVLLSEVVALRDMEMGEAVDALLDISFRIESLRE